MLYIYMIIYIYMYTSCVYIYNIHMLYMYNNLHIWMKLLQIHVLSTTYHALNAQPYVAV